VPADALPAYAFTLALLGLALFGAAWLPHALRDKALPFPLLYVLIGLALYGIAWPWDLPLPVPDPIAHGELLERLAELAVIISLMSVGLRIDTRFGWRRWSLTWRLLAVTMPRASPPAPGWACCGWTWAWPRRSCSAPCWPRPIRCSPPTSRCRRPDRAARIRSGSP
jgi:hypothetical protein